MGAIENVFASGIFHELHTNTHTYKLVTTPVLVHSGGLVLMTGSVTELNCTAGPSCPCTAATHDWEKKEEKEELEELDKYRKEKEKKSVIILYI